MTKKNTFFHFHRFLTIFINDFLIIIHLFTALFNIQVESRHFTSIIRYKCVVNHLCFINDLIGIISRRRYVFTHWRTVRKKNRLIMPNHGFSATKKILIENLLFPYMSFLLLLSDLFNFLEKLLKYVGATTTTCTL